MCLNFGNIVNIEHFLVFQKQNFYLTGEEYQKHIIIKRFNFSTTFIFPGDGRVINIGDLTLKTKVPHNRCYVPINFCKNNLFVIG